MQWYNNITNELQSDKPGSTLVDQDYWQSLYIDWSEVADDFRPPIPVPTTKEIYESINSIYSTKLRQILTAIQQATAMGNIDTVNKLNVTFAKAQAEWKMKLQEVVKT